MTRVAGLALLFALLHVLSVQPARGCVGARPLGMGGAFVAVADDANVTYWNPAALAVIRTRQITGMYVGGDDINYKYYGSYSQPLGERFAVAASFFTWNPRPVGFHQGHMMEFEYIRPWVSFAARIPQVTRGELSVGVNVDKAQAQITWRGEDETVDFDVGIDLSVLYRINEQWSVGLLVQDLNEPSGTIGGSTFTTFKRNVRPGIAFRPNERLTLAADIYDLTDGQYLMLGAEYWFNDKVGIRGGIYSLGGNDWPTVGASYRFSPTFSVEVAAMDFEYGVVSATYGF